eukprot:s2434_g4.t1
MQSQGPMPPSAESELPEQGEGETIEHNDQHPVRETDTVEGNLRDKRRVNLRDTAMGSKAPEGNVRDSIQGKATTKKKPMGDTLETPLGETMYQEAVLEKEKRTSSRRDPTTACSSSSKLSVNYLTLGRSGPGTIDTEDRNRCSSKTHTRWDGWPTLAQAGAIEPAPTPPGQ